MVKFDKTINIGTLLHLAGVIVTLVLIYSGIMSRLTVLETKVDALWRVFEVTKNAGH